MRLHILITVMDWQVTFRWSDRCPRAFCGILWLPDRPQLYAFRIHRLMCCVVFFVEWIVRFILKSVHVVMAIDVLECIIGQHTARRYCCRIYFWIRNTRQLRRVCVAFGYTPVYLSYIYHAHAWSVLGHEVIVTLYGGSVVAAVGHARNKVLYLVDLRHALCNCHNHFSENIVSMCLSRNRYNEYIRVSSINFIN